MRVDAGVNTVRIDGLNNQPQGVNDAARTAAEAPRKHRQSDPAGAGSSEDPQLLAAYRTYVRQAVTSEEVDSKAVAEARKLLESGQLDTSEAALRAAGVILERGI